MKKDDLSCGQLMTPEELSEYLRISKYTIYKLTSKGLLPGFKIGDSWRFDGGEILRLIRGKRISKGKEA